VSQDDPNNPIGVQQAGEAMQDFKDHKCEDMSEMISKQIKEECSIKLL